MNDNRSRGLWLAVFMLASTVSALVTLQVSRLLESSVLEALTHSLLMFGSTLGVALMIYGFLHPGR